MQRTTDEYESDALNLMKIVMILFVICIHFLSHAGYTDIDFRENMLDWCVISLVHFMVWVAVNGFVLISGYYLSQKTVVRREKIFSILDAMMFYSVVITVIFVVATKGHISVIQILYTIFPFSSQSWWFISCYIILYFLAPYINRVMSEIDNRELFLLIAVMIITFSIIPSFFDPFFRSFDMSHGFSVMWFVILYLIGGDIRRLESIPVWIGPIMYFAGTVCTVIFAFLAEYLGANYNDGFSGYTYNYIGYNYFTVVVASVGCFLMFKQLKIRSNIAINIIKMFSGQTIGIYLISEHPLMRERLFTSILHADLFVRNKYWPIYCIFCVATVFIICTAVEVCRKKWIVPHLKVYPLIYEKRKK